VTPRFCCDGAFFALQLSKLEKQARALPSNKNLFLNLITDYSMNFTISAQITP
jgi:phage gp36-like protein